MCFIILCVRRGCKVLLCPSCFLAFLSKWSLPCCSSHTKSYWRQPYPHRPYRLFGPVIRQTRNGRTFLVCGAGFISKYVLLTSKKCQPSSFLSVTNEMFSTVHFDRYSSVDLGMFSNAKPCSFHLWDDTLNFIWIFPRFKIIDKKTEDEAEIPDVLWNKIISERKR